MTTLHCHKRPLVSQDTGTCLAYLYTAVQDIGGHVAEIGTKFAHDQQSVDEANCVSVHTSARDAMYNPVY